MGDRGATRDVERFSRWAENYEHARFQRWIARIHDAMIATVPAEPFSPISILDIGCGTGRFLRKASLRWPSAQMVGVDPADGMISVARRVAPDVSFHVAAVESIPVADTHVVAVEGSGHNVHFDRPDQLASEVVKFAGGLGP